MSVSQFLANLEELNVHIDIIDDKLKIRAPEGKLTPVLLNELKDKKQEIIDFLQKKVHKQKYIAIEPAVEKEFYELSSAQMRMYFLQQMNLNSTVYNISYFEKLGNRGNTNKGAAQGAGIDVKRLEDAFKRLMARHESLRTSFHMAEDKPVQKIHREVDFKIEHYHKVEGFVRSFDLSQAPLLRVGIIATGAEGLLLGIDMHHIICDAASVNILVREFTYMYGYAHSDNHGLPQLRIQYKDYAEWQNSEMQRKASKKQEVYWLTEFSGEIPVLELPTDFHRPHIQSLDGNRLYFKIPAEMALGLTNMAAENGATLYTILLTILYILMTKISGQEDIVMGTPTAGRRHADLDGVIGMFVNTLALRNYPSGGKTFMAFLHEVNRRTQEAFENQDYQFEDMVEKLVLKRDAARNPLFDVMFSWLENDSKENTRAGSAENETPQNGFSNYMNPQSRFDMTWNGVGGKDHLFFLIEYCTKLFKEETILRFIEFFKKILSAIIENPERKISQIEIITGEEKKQILAGFNDIEMEYPREKTIHRLFVEQVERTPDNIAVIGPFAAAIHESALQLTYRELNEKSDRLAYMVMLKGIEPHMNPIIAIMVERLVVMIVGILGILKSGGAYLPIDPNYPQERSDYMLKDSGAAILLTENDLSDRIGNRYAGSTSQPASSMAYIIYTSGTTGRPKGTIIEHRNVVRLMFSEKFQFDFNHRDNWTMFHSSCFDFSVWEMYGALLYGGKLIIISRQTTRDMGRYLAILKKKCVTVLNQTPSAFSVLADLELRNPGRELSARYVIFGGEALIPSFLKNWKSKYPGTKLINMYGITETTVHVTFKELNDSDIEANISNIGKPIPTLSTIVIDKNLELQPIGVPGELCVRGEGVGRGYLNRPELSTEKFIENPYKAGDRLYKSGDLVKLLSTGDLQYLGRIDQQVKIRGFRIELGEVENRLLKISGVKKAVVLAVEEAKEKENKYLCAYFVSDKEYGISELRENLSRELPEYMIPSCFVRVEKMPLTANGKIDRKALPDPIIDPGGGYAAPQNEMEEKLVEIWAEVLGIEKTKIGIDHNFFELGGNSLRLISLVGKIYKEFKIDVPIIAQIYNEPRIRDMAIFMTKSNMSEQPVVLLNWKRPKKIFCLPDQNGYGYGYGSLGFLLDDYSLYTLTYIEDEDRINRYVDIITGIQPDGPYVFFGHSAAGKLTFVIAAALEKLGYEVSAIVFADSLFAENVVIELTEEYLVEFRTGVEDFLKAMKAEFLLEKVFAKAKKYMEYWNTIAALEKVNANVHLILSEEARHSTEVFIDSHCWDKLTTKSSRIYNGWGGHRDMLGGWALEKNIEIIKKILAEADFGAGKN
ncbi:MAG: amino acid adenylation domain-containing protein [Candidatus Aminicenantes bacterium]|nr:amino acid adenylation domain-containing protein [Candidatus Aminicenantes bacterium]